ncbi:hypothetical protein BEP19_02805 [Ammoniphilus oxalaticus]|uniref:Sporulation protein n=1 Tax=Ammoniphilus oxalaticus TaxID=66863 RepID=A0A419SNK9_9BACL|nr:sporulation protein [Ammoniphilus oxalaticus]RKD25878.1 hypothetical protein BEP19_02805 [Ammoniphilus oxalaticus]
MFKRMMAKFGIGAAKVDFVLKKPAYELGETVIGEFVITGGAVDQQINKITVDFNLKVRIMGKEITQVVASLPVHASFVMRAKERKIIPFTYELPFTLLISRETVSYTMTTQLDIAGGADHFDQDDIRILPPQRFNQLIQALAKSGFREKADSGFFNGQSQVFTFAPTSHFKNQVDEIAFISALEDSGIRLRLELKSLSLLPTGKQRLRRELFLSNEELTDINAMSNKIVDVVQQMIDHPQKYASPDQTGAEHFDRHHDVMSGAMGGFVAGMFSGWMMNELLFGEDEVESTDDRTRFDNDGFDISDGDGGDF